MKNKTSLSIMTIILVVGFACQVAPSGITFDPVDTPTHTTTPSPPPTKTPPPTITLTSTPLPIGVSLETREDGSSLFTDHTGGFTLSFPNKWFAFTFDLQGIDAVSQKVGIKNPQLLEFMFKINGLADDGYRVFAFDTNGRHSQNGYLPNLTVQIYTDPESKSFHPNEIADYWMKDIKQELPGTNVAVSHNRISTGGVFTSLIFDNTVYLDNNSPLKVTETIVIFQAYKALAIIHLYAPKETAYEVSKEINSLFQTIKGMRP